MCFYLYSFGTVTVKNDVSTVPDSSHTSGFYIKWVHLGNQLSND